MPFPVAYIAAATQRRKGQIAAPFVGAYDAIPGLVHVYEPARCTLSAYTGGALLRLRRDSDDAESDFSHVSATNPELDVAAIAAWAGGASYIVSVYDQKTGDTVTQAAQAAQPLFVASIQNGHAGGRLNGTSHYLQGAYTLGGALSQPYSVYAGGALDASAVDDGVSRNLFDGDDTTNRCAIYARDSAPLDTWGMFAGAILDSGVATDALWTAWSGLANGASSALWRNGVSIKTGNVGASNPDGLRIGTYDGVNGFWKGDWAWLVIADPSHSDAQRLAMQTAVNAYWGVY